MLSLPGASLDTIADLLGVEDLEMLIEQLLAIQHHQERKRV